MALDTWDQRYLSLARHISSWSKDPNAQVGAVITDENRTVAAIGYNGFPRGVEDSAERLNNKDLKNEMVVHAEENAALLAGDHAMDGTIYVTGKPVCPRCAGVIIQSGLKRVIAQMPKPGTTSHWDEVGRIAVDMLKEAGVEVIDSDD